jgi:hypothetical protein
VILLKVLLVCLLARIPAGFIPNIFQAIVKKLKELVVLTTATMVSN